MLFRWRDSLFSPQLIVPVGAGVTSALVFLVSPLASEQIKSHICPLNEMDWKKVNTMLTNMENEGFAFLKNAGVPDEEAFVRRIADMRYTGQVHDITVNLPNGELSDTAIEVIKNNFEAEYRLRYGKTIDDITIETVTWRSIVSGKVPEFELQQIVEQQSLQALKGYRNVYFPEQKTAVKCPVYDRYLLKVNESFESPAVIEEIESTTIIGFNATITTDKHRNLVVEMKYV